MPSITKDMDTCTYRLPLGVCAGIAPFNFPAMIPLWMFPMAMVCGNTFLMKPSERVPGALMFLAKLFQDAGAPDGTLNIIHGQHEGNNSSSWTGVCMCCGVYLVEVLELFEHLILLLLERLGKTSVLAPARYVQSS